MLHVPGAADVDEASDCSADAAQTRESRLHNSGESSIAGAKSHCSPPGNLGCGAVEALPSTNGAVEDSAKGSSVDSSSAGGANAITRRRLKFPDIARCSDCSDSGERHFDVL